MNELQNILSDQVNRLLGDEVEKKLLEDTETGNWPAGLWQAIEENGLTRVLVPEDRGGVGGTWQDAHVVLRAAGRYQAPVPLAEGVMAGWLLSQAGLDLPDGVTSVAPVRRDDALTLSGSEGNWRLSGTAHRVPWAGKADHLAVLASHQGKSYVALVAAGSWSVEDDANIAAEPRETVRFENAAVVDAAEADLPADAVYRIGALTRSAQIGGALEAVMHMSVDYANDRSQFGKPIGKFQAVQQELARLAGEVAASGAAAEAACKAMDSYGNCVDAGFEIACAKARASEAASTGASISHQAHGAIGFTYEHALHFATRRLWSWRGEFGSERYWAESLGRTLAERGADALWPFLSSR